MCSCLPIGLCCGCFLACEQLGRAWVNRPACARHRTQCQTLLFGAINVQSGHRTVVCRKGAGGADARAFLTELRRRYRKARTIWLLLDRAPAHTDTQTLRLAVELGIELVWLPKQWPELNAMD